MSRMEEDELLYVGARRSQASMMPLTPSQRRTESSWDDRRRRPKVEVEKRTVEPSTAAECLMRLLSHPVADGMPLSHCIAILTDYYNQIHGDDDPWEQHISVWFNGDDDANRTVDSSTLEHLQTAGYITMRQLVDLDISNLGKGDLRYITVKDRQVIADTIFEFRRKFCSG